MTLTLIIPQLLCWILIALLVIKVALETFKPKIDLPDITNGHKCYLWYSVPWLSGRKYIILYKKF